MDKGYEALASAIVLQAVKDYKRGYRRDEVENFIYSEWFKTLTNIHPDYIMKVCRDDSIKVAQMGSILPR